MDLILKPSCGGCGSTLELRQRNLKPCGNTIIENHANCYECGAPLTRLIQEVKHVEEEPKSDAKSNSPTKSASPPASSKCGSAPPSGPVTEHGTQVFVAEFKSRLKLEEEVKFVKDEPTLSVKSNPPTKSASPPASAKSGSAPTAWDLVADLKSRLDLLAEFESGLKLEEIEDDISHVLTPKKEPSKEDSIDNSTAIKSTASGAGCGTPSTSKPPFTKSNLSTKSASPPGSSKSGSAPPSGPVTEDEIRALLQGKPMTLLDFALKFYRRVTTKRDKDAFGAILRRITRIQKTGASYKEDLVFLREIEDDMSPVVAPKEEVPKEEPVDNSSFVKSSASGAGRGTPSTSKSSKGKSIKNGGESKTTNGPPLNKVKTENKIQEVKSVKDEPTSSTKCNAPTRSASPPASSKSGSAPSAGPIGEDEIRVLLQGTPKTVRDLVLPFESRLKTKRDQYAFMDLVTRITKKRKTGGADSKYVLFLEKETC